MRISFRPNGRRRVPRLAAWVRLLGWGQTARNLAESAAVGLVAGIGATAFLLLLEAAIAGVHAFAGGWEAMRPAGEPALFHFGEGILDGGVRRAAWVVLPALGGLVSGLLVHLLAPEAWGDGTDATIRAFHREGGEIRGRVPYVKALASVAVLATGGSAGREGPVIQIGAGFGSAVGRLLGLTPRRRRILLLAGAAGGLGAIFRAPLGGAITAIEALYREDFESDALIPSIVSSVTAYAFFTHLFGHGRIFSVPPGVAFERIEEIPFYVLLGLACALFGFFFVRLFARAKSFFARRSLPPWARPAAGGLLTGLLGLACPAVYGAGWGHVQAVILGEYSAAALLAIAVAKMFATAATMGSGGSGGTFGPSLFIGAMLGGALGRFFHGFFPSLAPHPAAFALVGMASFFAGVANAPVGALVMIAEMSGSYGLIAPLMLVSVLAILFTRDWGLYENQVRSRFDSPAHREDLIRDPLRTMRVRDLLPRLSPAPPPVPAAATMEELHRAFAAADGDFVLVAGTDGKVRGIIEGHHFLSAVEAGAGSGILAADIAVPIPAVRPAASLRRVLSEMLRLHVNHAVVETDEDPPRRFVVSSEEIEAAHVWFLDVEEVA